MSSQEHTHAANRAVVVSVGVRADCAIENRQPCVIATGAKGKTPVLLAHAIHKAPNKKKTASGAGELVGRVGWTKLEDQIIIQSVEVVFIHALVHHGAACSSWGTPHHA